MLTLRMSSIFAESSNRLPKDIKAKLPKAFTLLTSNPRHPSLQMKKIEGAVRPNVYECRLDQSWRIILQEQTDMAYDLVYVGGHDEAIQYGARIRERGVLYMPQTIEDRLEAYLAGDYELGFEAVTFKELDALSE